MINCIDSIKLESYDEKSVSSLVIGTEFKRVYILDRRNIEHDKEFKL